MATPQQRESLRIATKRWQVTKPILVGDFWNDGPCTGGCLSATRYAYVTPHGDVTPCTFVHFTTHNYKNHTLTEIMKSDFFKAIRGVQPYQPNLLRPCKIIDRPQVLRDIVDKVGAKPTYKGADTLIRNPEVMAHLDRYAEEWGKLADAAWATDTYQNGESVLIPFLGRINVNEHWAERTAIAQAQGWPGRENGSGKGNGHASEEADPSPKIQADGTVVTPEARA
jgi:hypothetical protein